MEYKKQDENMNKKPHCPSCGYIKYVNTMVKNFNGRWYLCSKCGHTWELE